MARLRKEQEKLQNKSPNMSKEQVTPTKSKEQITPKASKQQATPTTSSAPTSSSSPQSSPVGRRRSFGKVHTPPEVRKSNLPQRNGVNTEAVKQTANLSDDVVTDSIIDGGAVVDRQEVNNSNATPPQAADWKISAPPKLTQSTQVQREKEHPSSSAPYVKRERAMTPPPSSSVAVPAQQDLLMSPLGKSPSDTNLVAAGGGKKHEAVSKRNSHEDENWYLPGIPRLVSLNSIIFYNVRMRFGI